MSLARIRRFLLGIVTGRQTGGVSRPPSMAAVPSTAPARVVSGAYSPDAVFDQRGAPWVGEMASPSFMIVSTRPRR